MSHHRAALQQRELGTERLEVVQRRPAHRHDLGRTLTKVETKVVMRTIPEPPQGARTVLSILEGTGTVVIADDDKKAPLTYLCGDCPATLATRTYHGQLGTVVLKCNRCGSFNEAI